ncbi:hypothetical protein [Kitasatospora griseola]|uniref:hypothetical protein n=1 Tax=Kitasatospora griseola TaxID=2064 RepID=UPI00382CE7FD
MRITFTPQDLARTRIATTWGPLGETLLALTTLQQPHSRALFGGWRQEVQARSAALVHPASSLFRETVVDLFTVTGAASSVEEGIEALRAAPADLLHTELVGAVEARARYSRCTTPWAGMAWGDIAHDRGDREDLLSFLRDVHRVAVAPHWQRITSRLRAEQTTHALRLAQDGPEAMLAGLPPGFRWKPPTLEVGGGALTDTVDLKGRGLLLVPSAFCRTRPIACTDVRDEQSPLLLFLPVTRGFSDAAALLTTARHGTDGALSALLGRTRARTLHAIGDGPCTTGRLAERIRASLPTASEQATVLRRSAPSVSRGPSCVRTWTNRSTESPRPQNVEADGGGTVVPSACTTGGDQDPAAGDPVQQSGDVGEVVDVDQHQQPTVMVGEPAHRTLRLQLLGQTREPGLKSPGEFGQPRPHPRPRVGDDPPPHRLAAPRGPVGGESGLPHPAQPVHRVHHHLARLLERPLQQSEFVGAPDEQPAADVRHPAPRSIHRDRCVGFGRQDEGLPGLHVLRHGAAHIAARDDRPAAPRLLRRWRLPDPFHCRYSVLDFFTSPRATMAPVLPVGPVAPPAGAVPTTRVEESDTLPSETITPLRPTGPVGGAAAEVRSCHSATTTAPTAPHACPEPSG